MATSKDKKFCQTHRFWYTDMMCPYCYQDKNRGKFRRLACKEEPAAEETEEDYRSSLEKLIDKFKK